MEGESAQSSLANILSELNFLQYLDWDPAAIPGILVVLALIVLSAFVSGSEVAFFSLSQSQLSDLDMKRRKSQRIRDFLHEPEKLLGTILVGNNLFNVAFIVVSYFVNRQLFDFGEAVWVEGLFNAVVITSVLVLFGEIIPKTFAAKNNLRMAYATVNLLHSLYFVVSPLVIVLNRTSEVIQRRLTLRESTMTDKDIDKAIELTVGENTGEGSKEILKGIVKFGNTAVKQIMQPRMDVVAVEGATRYDELLRIVRDSGYSRIPVYNGDLDRVTGILYAKDLLAYLEEGPGFDWQRLQRQAYYVPESKKIDDLLEEFRHKRVHMAIVVDEYGGASGVVTLEDVLEEVIGEIKDEFDDEAEIQYKKIDEQSFVFNGKTQLNDVCRVVGISTDTFDEVKGEADTLAGLILEITGSLPKSGDSINYKNFTFKIITVNNIRIVRVQLTIHDKVEAAA